MEKATHDTARILGGSLAGMWVTSSEALDVDIQSTRRVSFYHLRPENSLSIRFDAVISLVVHGKFAVGQDGEMATPPVILLPPSEGKAAGGKGSPVRLSKLSFPELEAQRDTLRAALGAAMKGKEPARAKLLGVKGTALAAATATNLDVLKSPTMPAIDRYTGVLYDALDAMSLSTRDHKRLLKQVLIFSALWGVVRPGDMIPDYKLKMGATLAPIGKVSSWWRQPVTSALSSTVGGSVVWNLLPKEHDNAWAPFTAENGAGSVPSAIFSVKFLDEGAPVKGERSFTTVNHWNKLLKGALVRFILETGADDPKALSKFRHPEGYRYDRTLTEVSESGTVVCMVRPTR